MQVCRGGGAGQLCTRWHKVLKLKKSFRYPIGKGPYLLTTLLTLSYLLFLGIRLFNASCEEVKLQYPPKHREARMWFHVFLGQEGEEAAYPATYRRCCPWHCSPDGGRWLKNWISDSFRTSCARAKQASPLYISREFSG